MKPALFLQSLALVLLVALDAAAFVTPSTNIMPRHWSTTVTIHLKFSGEEEPEFPQLPAFGASSTSPLFTPPSKTSTDENNNKSAVVSPKFEIQYTCKKCDARNSHQVSRAAYSNGVVVCICKGCMAKHLIADNLGWYNYKGGFEGDATIEEFFNNRGLEDGINRVSSDVFHLENIYYDSDKSGNVGGGME